METAPVLEKLVLVKLGPRFHESLLSSRQGACEGFDRIKSEDSHIVLIIRVEVRKVVRPSCFCEHPDNDPEEPRNLWHHKILAV